MKVYISGPMSGLSEHNYPAFFAAAEIVRKEGDEPINPAEGAPEGWTWEQYMRRAIALLLGADAILTLPGWQESKGARLEYVVAQHLGMATGNVLDSEV